MGVRGQAGQELADLGFAHFGWVPLPVEKDEAGEPPDIRFLCSGTDGEDAAGDNVQELIRGSRGRAELDREGPEERAAAVEAVEPRLPGDAHRLPVLFPADAAVDLGKLLARAAAGRG